MVAHPGVHLVGQALVTVLVPVFGQPHCLCGTVVVVPTIQSSGETQVVVQVFASTVSVW